jgi:DegV family protein with EDD domain
MSKVAIVTDTISCLPEALAKKYGIQVVPVILVVDGKSYKDLVDMKPDDFWRQFDTMKNFSTSAALPADFIQAFEQAGKESRDIVCTVVSKKMSATYQTAVQARDILKLDNSPLNIEILDSRTAAGAQGFVALEGARTAEKGGSLAEVVQAMEGMIKKAKWVCGVETTKYLIKTGRVPKTVPIEVFEQVKPMIAQLHDTGFVEDMGAARGKEECFQKLVQMVGENTDLTRPLHVNVHYTNNIADGRRLLEMVKARYNCAEIYLTPYSAVMCGTTGPCNAISFYS